MTIAEKIELGLIPTVGVALWCTRSSLPLQASTGSFLLGAAVLLLGQGFLRDLFLLARQRRAGDSGPLREARCMCVESTVGVTGVLAGLCLLASRFDRIFPVPPWVWSLSAMFLLAVGFVLKDCVFEWFPFRFYRDRDHVNLVFTWKRQPPR